MPGVVKKKYQGETYRIVKQMKRQLYLIMQTLKPWYTENDILNAYKKYYSLEWQRIEERYSVYTEKDKFLQNKGKKKRYKHKEPKAFFCSLPIVKHLLSDGYRAIHTKNYNEEARLKYIDAFEAKRFSKQKKSADILEKNKKKIQDVDPGFIKALIYAYHNKANRINDKLEIFYEIQKYECEESVRFFNKLNDSERNNEIRELAFKHLQEIGHYVKLRPNFKGKKKSYNTEKSDFNGTPEKLAKKLQSSKSIQNIKHYDLFISHSSRDKEKVLDIVKKANEANLNCYVDWTSDNDFLKRNLVSDFTKEVLKKRLEQSDNLLYLSSEAAKNSSWVRFEIEYYQKNVKGDIIMIVLEGEDPNNFKQINADELQNYSKK